MTYALSCAKFGQYYRVLVPNYAFFLHILLLLNRSLFFIIIYYYKLKNNNTLFFNNNKKKHQLLIYDYLLITNYTSFNYYYSSRFFWWWWYSFLLMIVRRTQNMFVLCQERQQLSFDSKTLLAKMSADRAILLACIVGNVLTNVLAVEILYQSHVSVTGVHTEVSVHPINGTKQQFLQERTTIQLMI